MSHWRALVGDLPDWRDGGDVEVRKSGGEAVRGYLSAGDVGFDGDCEYPIWTLTLESGALADLFSFDEWRKMAVAK